MNRSTLVALVLLCPLAAAIAGCPQILDLLQPRTDTVRLVNNGDFDVEVDLDIDDDQEVPEDLIDEVGSRLEYTIPAGETVTFTRDCEDLQAIKVARAELRVLGQIGPNVESDILRDGDEFTCGDTITFTFDHSQLLIDFDVSAAVAD